MSRSAARTSLRWATSELTLLRRSHIGFVFQAFNLLPMLTAEENVDAARSRSPAASPTVRWVDAVIERVGLADRRDHRPSELSGGQQQRVAIARALVGRADRAVRRRADRQPRLAHRAPRCSALLREAVDAYGQTT